MRTLQDSPLGKPSRIPTDYAPSLLYPIPRATMREGLSIRGTLPFYGLDIWNAYELSWLNKRGKPQIAIADMTVPANSPCILESKSLKLYLQSLSQKQLTNTDAVLALLQADLSDASGTPVTIRLTPPSAFSSIALEELGGLLLDRLDIEATQYVPSALFLKADTSAPPVEETLVSHLLKTNCPVTGQPDWASIQIHYVGPAINQEGLLKYLISYRSEKIFHEQCVERIFMDILNACRPESLTVYARYTRRGGISINPWRSNASSGKRPLFVRNARQ
ncbi:MAG: NADPH-dependent 7-cyano-7-deazaguanine reductase QueF [Burkholderiaceae bacterium]|jgi:7-cyano-7-deazaguanine reductase|nr:NADPH-dependent 7-cyano-7-deazaguanine reductase QueF [Burkholderiaceae bacterium]